MAQLRDVNTTDIRDAIELGCQTMCSVFNAADNDIPFFGSSVWPEAALSFSPAHSEAHVPGRHLNALLNAEDATSVEIDESCINKHAQAAFFSYSGALPVPLNRDKLGGSLVNFIPHNIREGFHALYALVKYRDSQRARELAEASIQWILDYWDPGLGWDEQRIVDVLPATNPEWLHGNFITGLARALGPLVKYYRVTGHAPALELALVLKDRSIAEHYLDDGSYHPDRLGTHAHSVTCVLSSLAQLADLTGDAPLLNRVKAFYDNGLWQIRDALGWAIEGTKSDADPDRGEVNTTGDILETALILGRWGYTHYYHDAERILRGHLLPSQLRDVSFITDAEMAERHRGAFGFPAPYSHHPIGCDGISFNMDIVGGAVGSLCEAYRSVTRLDQTGHWVNLLFDHETEAIKVESPYTHAALRVTVKQPAPLLIRIPPWVDRNALLVKGTERPVRYSGDYLFLAEPVVDQPVSIRFPLVEQEISLHHRTREICVRLRGDEVVAMDNFGADLTFFNSIN